MYYKILRTKDKKTFIRSRKSLVDATDPEPGPGDEVTFFVKDRSWVGTVVTTSGDKASLLGEACNSLAPVNQPSSSTPVPESPSSNPIQKPPCATQSNEAPCSTVVEQPPSATPARKPLSSTHMNQVKETLIRNGRQTAPKKSLVNNRIRKAPKRFTFNQSILEPKSKKKKIGGKPKQGSKEKSSDEQSGPTPELIEGKPPLDVADSELDASDCENIDEAESLRMKSIAAEERCTNKGNVEATNNSNAHQSIKNIQKGKEPGPASPRNASDDEDDSSSSSENEESSDSGDENPLKKFSPEVMKVLTGRCLDDDSQLLQNSGIDLALMVPIGNDVFCLKTVVHDVYTTSPNGTSAARRLADGVFTKEIIQNGNKTGRQAPNSNTGPKIRIHKRAFNAIVDFALAFHLLHYPKVKVVFKKKQVRINRFIVEHALNSRLGEAKVKKLSDRT